MQSNPVCSALGAQRSHFAPIFAIVNVISGFKCELHLSPIHALFSPLHMLPVSRSRLLHEQIFGHLNATDNGIDCGSAAESWPIKWAAVSEARRRIASVSARSKRFESQLQYFLVLALTVECCPLSLPPSPPFSCSALVAAHRFTGCGCAMLFGLRSKLTSVLFVRFPFGPLVVPVRLPFLLLIRHRAGSAFVTLFSATGATGVTGAGLG